MDNTQALESLVNITNSNLGYVPSTPSEFNELSRSIQKKTCRTISLSSIKRIWGYVKYDGFPSVTTLNTLAQYNGYKDWEAFLEGSHNKYGEDSGFLDESVVNESNLQIGDKLLLRWDNEKSCEIEYVEAGRFRVNRSQNIKLQAGDVFTLHTLCVGHPIYVSDIQRGDLHIPGYIGAKKGGVTTIIRCVDN